MVAYQMKPNGARRPPSPQPEDGGLAAGFVDLAAEARLITARREAMTRHLDPCFCTDPAIDILLFLFVRGEDGNRTPTSACCEAVRSPRTTVLRWIARLDETGLVLSDSDPDDRRVTLLSLSPAGRAAIAGWLREISEA